MLLEPAVRAHGRRFYEVKGAFLHITKRAISKVILEASLT